MALALDELPTIVDYVPNLILETFYPHLLVKSSSSNSAAIAKKTSSFHHHKGEDFEEQDCSGGGGKTGKTVGGDPVVESAGAGGSSYGTTTSFSGKGGKDSASAGSLWRESNELGERNGCPLQKSDRGFLWVTKKFSFKGEFTCTRLDATDFPLDIQRLTLHLKARSTSSHQLG